MANIVATKGNIDPALLDVTAHPQTRELQREFTRKMNDYADSLNYYCPTCKERYFGKTFSLTSPNACKKCESFFNKHGFYERTADNDMDPFPNGLPTQFPTNPLPKATPMEETMFSRVLVRYVASKDCCCPIVTY